MGDTNKNNAQTIETPSHNYATSILHVGLYLFSVILPFRHPQTLHPFGYHFSALCDGLKHRQFFGSEEFHQLLKGTIEATLETNRREHGAQRLTPIRWLTYFFFAFRIKLFG